jgi:hypothetical protein
MVVVTMGYGVTAAVVAKEISLARAVPSQFLQGQGGTLQYPGHRGGVQSIDDTRPANPPARITKAHGYI